MNTEKWKGEHGMTRMQAMNFLGVVKGYIKGRQLQCRGKLDNSTPWVDVLDNPTFSDNLEWRLKPEHELVPFDFNTNLLGRVIIERNHTYRQLILDQDSDVVFTRTESIAYTWLLEAYTFVDGTECGKEQ